MTHMLDMQTVSPPLLEARDLEIAVPGQSSNKRHIDTQNIVHRFNEYYAAIILFFILEHIRYLPKRQTSNNDCIHLSNL